ncbi:MAG: hypothetical protein PHH11_02765 [Methylomonas sp.]|nr:hypothetical protein [Methylomonas sp.]
MKRLFFALCLLNLTFFLWQFHAGRMASPVHQPDMPSSLLLVEEYQRARRGASISALLDGQWRRWQEGENQRLLADLQGEEWQREIVVIPVAKKTVVPVEVKHTAKKQDAPVKPVVQPVEKVCIEIGPFLDQPAVNAWLAGKSIAGKQILQKEVAVPGDYQVYYPAARTPEQSASNKAMLLAKGLQDIWSIPTGELKGGYSLGVFRDRQRAVVFKGQLAEKGIHAEIRQREKTTSQWFIKTMLEKNRLKQFQSSAPKLSSCSSN